MLPSIKLNNEQMNSPLSQVNEDSEYIDLTQDESSTEEKDSFHLLLGKKPKRKKNKDKNKNKNKDIYQKNLSFDNSFDNEEEFYPPKKIINTDDFNCDDCEDNNNYEIERDALLKLVKLEGFNKIFTLITKAKFDSKNSIEKKLEEIIFNIGLLRTSLILLQFKFTLIQNSSNDNTPQTLNTKKQIELSNRESQIKDLEKKGFDLSHHLHKDKDGKIYKYVKNHLRARNIYVFNCGDRKCKSKGLYFLKNMEFKIVLEHSIPHEEHSYIKSPIALDQYKPIFDDFKERDCKEAQIFKNRDGDKLVKWYNNCSC